MKDGTKPKANQLTAEAMSRIKRRIHVSLLLLLLSEVAPTPENLSC